MKKQITYITLCMLVISLRSLAQNPELPLRPIKVGDVVPDIYLNNISNYKATSAKFSDFYNHKVIIIDFWATWCSPCLAALPNLQKVQNELKDDVLVLVVNSSGSGDSKITATKELQKRGINLTSIVEDNILEKLFPHQVVPHDVWIDHNGRVIAITSDQEVTISKVKALVNQQKLDLKSKIEVFSDPTKPLAGVQFENTEIKYRSILLNHKEGFNGGTFRHFDTDQKRVLLAEDHLMRMFLFAGLNGYNYNFNTNKIIWNVSDSLLYKIRPRDVFRPDKYFKSYDEYEKSRQSYELIMPPETSDSTFYQTMLSELNKLFNLKARVEKRTIPCWLLVRTDLGKDLIATKGGEWVNPGGHGNGNRINLQNAKMALLVNLLSYFKGMDVIFDETNYKGNIDIDLDFNDSKTYDNAVGGMMQAFPLDIELAQKELAKYGLKLVRSKREQDVIVFTDKPEVYKNWGL